MDNGVNINSLSSKFKIHIFYVIQNYTMYKFLVIIQFLVILIISSILMASFFWLVLTVKFFLLIKHLPRYDIYANSNDMLKLAKLNYAS